MNKPFHRSLCFAKEVKHYKAQMYYTPLSSLMERVGTSSVGQHYPRMAGFKFKFVYMCVRACMRVCVRVKFLTQAPVYQTVKMGTWWPGANWGSSPYS